MNTPPLPPKPAWETDFPIERIEATHVSRREFAKFLCLVSGGLAVGSGWVAVKDRLFPAPEIKGEYFVGKASGIPPGTMKSFTVPETGLPYLLIHRNGGEWSAFEQKCTHLSCAVIYCAEEDKIECPCHNGWFDAGTGDVLQGPPPRPLPRLAVILRGDDIFVTEWPEAEREPEA